MRFKLFFHTLRYLKYTQIRYQLCYRIRKKLRERTGFCYKFSIEGKGKPLDLKPFIPKYTSLNQGNTFTFLNQTYLFKGWNCEKIDKLWSYNLNYMDFLHQKDFSIEQGEFWINCFVDDIAGNKDGMEPYPIALRGINWIKFLSRYHPYIPFETKQKWDYSLYAQYKILMDNLEYHLLGNHLLEDAFSLLWGGLYFKDEILYRKAEGLLYKELNKQVLPDGSHYELSPMYHQILLERLLDCINALKYNLRYCKEEELTGFMENKAIQMLGWLGAIVYKDGSIPLFNDAAYGIAPQAYELFSYAGRLGLKWEKGTLRESGYRRFESSLLELVVDVGHIGPDYIPGHAHADTFNYELRIAGRLFIIDTGISTYNKNARRQYERETQAHNTVTIGNIGSSQVWGGFRVAKRAKIMSLKEGNNYVEAIHDGFKSLGIKHQRRFTLDLDKVQISDTLFGSKGKKAVNRIILSPDVEIYSVNKELIKTNLGTIFLRNVQEVTVEDCKVSTHYNSLIYTHKVICSFTSSMEYTITGN